MQGKIISLCYIISLFLYLLRVRFGSRVWLKPREKQVPAAPKSLKANVDKPQLKYKAVCRENVHNGIQRKFLLKRFCLQGKIISLCYIISLFLYLLRVRFGSRVWLKPREKQVPAAPKSLKANVDKPQLKYKAVWRENVARESTFNGKYDVLIFCKFVLRK